MKGYQNIGDYFRPSLGEFACGKVYFFTGMTPGGKSGLYARLATQLDQRQYSKNLRRLTHKDN